MGSIKGVQGASVASAMRFGENFIKQKFQGTPLLVTWRGPQGSGRPMSGYPHMLELWNKT